MEFSLHISRFWKKASNSWLNFSCKTVRLYKSNFSKISRTLGSQIFLFSLWTYEMTRNTCLETSHIVWLAKIIRKSSNKIFIYLLFHSYTCLYCLWCEHARSQFLGGFQVNSYSFWDMGDSRRKNRENRENSRVMVGVIKMGKTKSIDRNT